MMSMHRAWSSLPLLLAAGLTLGVSERAGAGGVLEYASGHGDIGVALEDGELFLHYHLGPGAVLGGEILAEDEEFEPSDLITRVAGPPVPRPDGASWDFIGTAAGAPLYFLPQVNDPDKPFLGFATEELDPADWESELTWTLVGFMGPGQFSTWRTGLFGGIEPVFTTSDGLSDADSFTQGPGTHEHFVFGFTSPGVHKVRLHVSGTHKTLGELSDVETFRFIVGDAAAAVPEPSTAIAAVVGLGTILASRRRIRHD